MRSRLSQKDDKPRAMPNSPANNPSRSLFDSSPLMRADARGYCSCTRLYQIRATEGGMSEHVYKQVELTGTSKSSVEDAVQNAITKAGKTLHNIHWFQVVDTRGYVENNAVDYWQVTIKLGFRLDD
jgi:dodecin